LLRDQSTPAAPGVAEADRFPWKIIRESSVAGNDPTGRVTDGYKPVDVLDKVLQRYGVMGGEIAVCNKVINLQPGGTLERPVELVQQCAANPEITPERQAQQCHEHCQGESDRERPLQAERA
jgi:hypothetical protein